MESNICLSNPKIINKITNDDDYYLHIFINLFKNNKYNKLKIFFSKILINMNCIDKIKITYFDDFLEDNSSSDRMIKLLRKQIKKYFNKSEYFFDMIINYKIDLDKNINYYKPITDYYNTNKNHIDVHEYNEFITKYFIKHVNYCSLFTWFMNLRPNRNLYKIEKNGDFYFINKKIKRNELSTIETCCYCKDDTLESNIYTSCGHFYHFECIKKKILEDAEEYCINCNKIIVFDCLENGFFSII